MCSGWQNKLFSFSVVLHRKGVSGGWAGHLSVNSRMFLFAALTLTSCDGREFLKSSDVIHAFELVVYLQGKVLTFSKHLGFAYFRQVVETSHSHLNLNIEQLLSSP